LEPFLDQDPELCRSEQLLDFQFLVVNQALFLSQATKLRLLSFSVSFLLVSSIIVGIILVSYLDPSVCGGSFSAFS
jgi:hypothetical protein